MQAAREAAREAAGGDDREPTWLCLCSRSAGKENQPAATDGGGGMEAGESAVRVLCE